MKSLIIIFNVCFVFVVVYMYMLSIIANYTNKKTKAAKSFNFEATKFRGLKTLDMLVDI